jgi:hypothetical protein
MSYMIYPYSSGSEGAKNISEGLGGMRIKRSGSTYSYKDTDVVINWGASDNPFPKALNANIASVLSKKAFFDRCKYAGITPRFAFDQAAAKALNAKLVCRALDKGKDGEGISIWEGDGPLPNAVLYVELIAKTEEYRVHVGRTKDGEIVLIGHQRKFKKGGGEIWTGDSCNFVWTVNGLPVVLPQAVKDVAVKALDLFGEVTFAGFDIIYDGTNAYVLEANSAPMMTPKTVECYTTFFNKFYPA